MIDPYEHIEDYIKGRLSDTDKLAFDSALSHDKELQLLVENYQEISNVSEGLLELELLNEVKEVGQTMGFGDRWKYWKIILPILILIGIAYVGFQSAQKAKNLKMQKTYFAANYDRPDNPDTYRSVDINDLDDLEKAKYYFDLNEFEKAEKVLLLYIDSESSNKQRDEAYFWLGHTQLNLSKYRKALQSFNRSKFKGSDELAEFCLTILN